MLAVINQLSIKAEFVERVESAFLKHTESLAQEPGFCGFRFLRALNPDESPCIVEVFWADQAAFEAWKKSENFRESHQGMGEFRAGFYAPPKFAHFSVSKDIPLTV